MARIDYFVSLGSPWSHFGAARIEAIARRHDAELRIYPVEFGKVIFPASGGLPVSQRSPQRQAYRLQELARWRSFLDIPIDLDPTYFPYDESLASQAVVAVRELIGDRQAVALAHRVLKAVWEESRNCADPAELAGLLRDVGLEPTLLEEARRDEWARQRRADSEMALSRGVFGAPSYLIGDELFWGQDRLDFVERELGRE